MIDPPSLRSCTSKARLFVSAGQLPPWSCTVWNLLHEILTGLGRAGLHGYLKPQSELQWGLKCHFLDSRCVLQSTCTAKHISNRDFGRHFESRGASTSTEQNHFFLLKPFIKGVCTRSVRFGSDARTYSQSRSTPSTPYCAIHALTLDTNLARVSGLEAILEK